jgi:1-acyl-sn-glycerol-3-phosphate acyltransferase
VLVFPEGHHTTDGKIRPFRSGIGLLAKNLQIPVVPMRIDGLFELKQADKKLARPFQITVKTGAPVRFPPDADPEWITRELHKKVEEL